MTLNLEEILQRLSLFRLEIKKLSVLAFQNYIKVNVTHKYFTIILITST